MILWKVSFAGMNFGQRYDIVGNKFFWHELQVLITQNQIFQAEPHPPPPFPPPPPPLPLYFLYENSFMAHGLSCGVSEMS